MFSLSGVSGYGYNSFAQGAYCNNRVNGLQVMAMQSQEYTDKLIEQFEMAIAAGYNPNMVYEDVFSKVGCSEADLTDFDKVRLQQKVESMYRSNASHRQVNMAALKNSVDF